MVTSESVPFVYLASVCRSLQCLISALTQAGRGGLLFRFASSVALLGGGALLSQSTLLRLPAALYGAGPALYAVPVFRYSTKAQTRLRLHSVPSRPGQLRQPGACRAHSPWVRCAFSPPRFQPQFPPAPVGCVCLMFSRDHPSGCQPSRTSGSLWLETGGLFAVWEGMPSLGPNLPLSPSPCLLPPAGMGQSTAG